MHDDHLLAMQNGWAAESVALYRAGWRGGAANDSFWIVRPDGAQQVGDIDLASHWTAIAAWSGLAEDQVRDLTEMPAKMGDARERDYLARIAAAQWEYDAAVGALPDVHAAERALDAEYPGAVFPLPVDGEHYRRRAALWDAHARAVAPFAARLQEALDALMGECPDHPYWEGWGSI